MSFYIKKKDQEEILKLIIEFQKETKCGKIKTTKSDKIFEKLVNVYLFKLINGVIYSPIWKYYTYINSEIEKEELINEAMFHLYKAFNEAKFDPTKKTSLFAFLTAVISNNIRTITKNKNRNMKFKSEAGIEKVAFLEKKQYKDNLKDIENSFSEDFFKIFEILKTKFEENNRYLKIIQYFEIYLNNFNKKKFLKKDFIKYCKSLTGYSDSFINNFFKKIKNIKEIREILK